ncbi:MAG: hypothetical protein JSW58_13310 [Candidatus Latescibacterota bacterium]|nr:MAG: hypothetical protein JSW58_13310 [Candidatus Latescibacterota bacterium]
MRKRTVLRNLSRLVVALGLFAITAASFVGCTTTYTQVPPPPPPPEPPVEYVYEDTYDGFEELSEYGTWVIIEPHGWVWRPAVATGWRPYVHGHWMWSNWGWTWVSYEPYGWAVYHYGYWHYDPIWGWMWLPGNKWFSARVKWIVYDDYICWAPMPPPGYYIGDPWGTDVHFIWHSVHVKHFTHDNVHRFTLRPPRPRTPIAKTNIKARKAPELRLVERHIKRPIRPVKVEVKDVTVGKRTYQKMKLPPGEKKKVDRYEPRVKKKVIKQEPRKRVTGTPKKKSTPTKGTTKRAKETKRGTSPKKKKPKR